MKLRNNLLLGLVALTVCLTASQAATIGMLGNGGIDDGDNEHFILLSTTAFTPATASVVNSWSAEIDATRITASESVVPLIFTSSGGTSGPFTIAYVGSALTTSETNEPWGSPAPLNAGTDYYFGFAQDSNAVLYGTSTTASNPIPITNAWINGNVANHPPAGSSGVVPGDGVGTAAFGDTYTHFNTDTLGTRHYNVSFEVNPIPEPSSALLGLLGLSLLARRRR